jgi:hypothetical protein
VYKRVALERTPTIVSLKRCWPDASCVAEADGVYMPRAARGTKSGIVDLNRHQAAYLTPSELARYWNLSAPQVVSYIRARQLTALRFSDRLFRIATRDALEFERHHVPELTPFTDPHQ